MTDRRITADEVIAAYQKTGLRPVIRKYLDVDCGCPLSALYFSEHPDAPRGASGANTVEWAEDTYGTLYRLGFVDGFDYMCPRGSFGRMLEGESDGIAVRKALEANGMLEVSDD
ncbi:MAG: hypothetical protein KGL39_34545 [Patescibacteria group bacterium]|nr:hypothetical protein [Patescibacteria group bacterium]